MPHPTRPRSLFQRQNTSDWAEWRLEGFSAWPGPANQHIDERVAEFVAAGDPPVLVCLGTSAAAGAGPALATMADGLEQRGYRPLVLVGDAANLASVGE